MKRLNRISITRSALIASALAIGVFASTHSAQAQQFGSLIGTATIPFTFQAGTQEMPAGVYEIRRVATNALQLRGGPKLEAHYVSTHTTEAAKTPKNGSVVFHRYGDTFFLGQVWVAGTPFGAECYSSKAEDEMRASTHKAPASIQLSFNSSPPQ
jgi:hypothetical protein